MKSYWQHASTREKQVLILGAGFLSLILLYKMTLGYLFNTTAELRDNLTDQQSQLTWMQATAKQIETLSHRTQSSENLSIAALLNRIQSDLEQMGLGKNIVSLQESENHTIEIHLQHIPFDRFITWLTSFSEDHHLIISKAAFTPESTPGVVQVSLSLQN